MKNHDRINEIAKLDKIIRIGRAVDNLENNADFKIFNEWLTINKPLELTYLLGTLEKDKVHADNTTRLLEAIALYRTFLEEARSNAYDAEETKRQLTEDN
jgi:hypothetical protein